jgi:AhpD family alkylhydroperoxidase
MERFRDIGEELNDPTRDLRRMIPDAWSGMTQLHTSALADGAVPARLKEVMALAISVVKRCDGCIAHHAKRAARLGATPEEVAEALGVALLMDGGPATVYAPLALQAYREFARQSTDATAVPVGD